MKPFYARCFAIPLLVFLLAIAPAFGRAALPQDRAKDLKIIDQQIQNLELLLSKYDRGDCYLVGVSTWQATMVAISKDEVANALAALALMGEIKSTEVASAVREMKQFSDQAADTIRKRIAKLRETRQKILNPAGPRATGYFRLKEGYPKFQNQMRNGPGYTVDYDVSGSSVTIHYHEVNPTTGKVIEDFTMSSSFTGLGKNTIEGGEELKIDLSGTWNYAVDPEHYDGFGPALDWRGVWFSVKDAQPRHGTLSATDSAALWLGRYTSGIVYPSDRRKITAILAKSGSAKTDYICSLSFGKYGQLVWTYEWVAF